MQRLTFEIEAESLRRFAGLAAAGFLVTGLDRAAANLGAVAGAAEVRAALAAKNITLQNLTDDPRIAEWRRAIAACGLKASTFKGSAEQLSRRFLKGESISTPLPVVNAYCEVSARHLAPMAGYDLDRFRSPELAIRLGRPGTDKFSPLGGRAADMPVTADVVVYASGDTVVCWAFNHRDSQETCLTADTRTAAFFGEAVTAVQREAMVAALEEMAGLLKAAGAEVGQLMLADAKSPRFTLGE